MVGRLRLFSDHPVKELKFPKTLDNLGGFPLKPLVLKTLNNFK